MKGDITIIRYSKIKNLAGLYTIIHPHGRATALSTQVKNWDSPRVRL